MIALRRQLTELSVKINMPSVAEQLSHENRKKRVFVSKKALSMLAGASNSTLFARIMGSETQKKTKEKASVEAAWQTRASRESRQN